MDAICSTCEPLLSNERCWRAAFVPDGPGVASQASPAADECTPSARVAMSFYQSVNQRDMHAAVADMTADVAYEDLQMFAEAKVGKDTVFRMLEAYQGLDPDVLFVIDDVTAASAGGVATVWHLEVRRTGRRLEVNVKNHGMRTHTQGIIENRASRVWSLGFLGEVEGLVVETRHRKGGNVRQFCILSQHHLGADTGHGYVSAADHIGARVCGRMGKGRF